MPYATHIQPSCDVKIEPSSTSVPSPAPRSLGGRLWKIGMGLLLIWVGWIFVGYLWHSYLRAAEMDTWVELPCTIEAVSIDEAAPSQRGMPQYLLKILYRYQFEEETFTGDRWTRLPLETSDLDKLKSSAAKFTVGTVTKCYVDPDAPMFAVLKKDSKAPLYSIWFPCLFLIGGIGMILSALFRKRA